MLLSDCLPRELPLHRPVRILLRSRCLPTRSHVLVQRMPLPQHIRQRLLRLVDLLWPLETIHTGHLLRVIPCLRLLLLLLLLTVPLLLSRSAVAKLLTLLLLHALSVHSHVGHLRTGPAWHALHARHTRLVPHLVLAHCHWVDRHLAGRRFRFSRSALAFAAALAQGCWTLVHG